MIWQFGMIIKNRLDVIVIDVIRRIVALNIYVKFETCICSMLAVETHHNNNNNWNWNVLRSSYLHVLSYNEVVSI